MYVHFNQNIRSLTLRLRRLHTDHTLQSSPDQSRRDYCESGPRINLIPQRMRPPNKTPTSAQEWAVFNVQDL